MSIAVIGSVFVDVKAYPYDKFIPNGRNAGYDIQVFGGVCRNIAENLSRMGVDTRFISLVDDTGLGENIISGLNLSGVNTDFVKKSESGMGKWIAIFDNKGEVAASISVRPKLEPLAAIIEEHHKEIFEPADSIVLDIDIEDEAVERAIRYAKQYRRKVFCVVSVMSIALERRKYFKDIDVLTCNLQEAGMLFGEDLSSLGTDEIKEYLSANLERTGLKSLIVTLGKGGAVYCDADKKTGYCAAKEVIVVDSTGAGDAFASGAYHALTLSKSYAEACRLGCEIAALVVSSDQNVVSEIIP